MRRLLLVALFLEVGVVLIIVPWSAFWDRNYFAQQIPFLQALITNNFMRGAVSGVGLINVLLGLRELVSIVMARASQAPASISPARLTEDRDLLR